MDRDSFVAVQKDGSGNIHRFKTSSGEVLEYQEALSRVKNGEIQDVTAFKGKDGDTYIRGVADGNPDNNLDNLPTF